jgi:hypothetical protein
MRHIRQLTRHVTLILAVLAAVAIPAGLAAGPAHAAPFPRFVSVPRSAVVVLQNVGQILLGDGGSYRVHANVSPNNSCLDANSSTVGHNGGPAVTSACNGTRFQNWAFDSTDVVGLYRLRTGANGRCLDADNRFGGGNLTIVQMWDCLGAGQLNQFWWLVDNVDSVFLASNLDGRCILADDVWARGGTVVLFDCLGQPQSKWLPVTF